MRLLALARFESLAFALLFTGCGITTAPGGGAGSVGGTPDLWGVGVGGGAGSGSDSGGGGIVDLGVAGRGNGAGADLSVAGGPGAADGMVSCGAVACAAPQVCCFSGVPNLGTHGCAASGGCGSNLAASCDGPEDCSVGQVCCAGQGGASCAAASACTGLTDALLCHTDSDCAGQAANKRKCLPSMFSPWTICKM